MAAERIQAGYDLRLHHHQTKRNRRFPNLGRRTLDHRPSQFLRTKSLNLIQLDKIL